MAIVWAVPKESTFDGYHHVTYTKGKDLNRGKTRRFRDWSKAKEFAKKKALELGCKADIHPR